MKFTNDARARIIDAYANGHEIKQIASVFNIKLNTVYATINIYKKENQTERKLKGGNRKNLFPNLIF